jgi:hypothetical protein
MSRTAVRSIAIVGVAFFGVTGLWAFFDPRGFYDVLATYPPFNEHLFHDIGAFQIGLAAALLAGLFWDSGLGVALVGAATAAAVHTLSHVMDRDLGGRATDPAALGVFTVLLIVALVGHVRRYES